MSSKYKVQYKKSVGDDLRTIPSAKLKSVVSKIRALANNPHPSGSIKLRGSTNLFRIQYGDYRVVYQVNDATLIVLVVKVAHRGDRGF